MFKDSSKFNIFSASIGVSSLGSAINFIAFNVFTYQITNSPTKTGLVMIIRLFASIVTGIYVAKKKNINHRKAIFYSDIIQMLALLTLVYMPGVPKLPLLYIVSFICGMASVCHSICLRSMIPQLVKLEDRPEANGKIVLARSTGTILGMSAGGLIISNFGYNSAFLIDAATFFLSAITLQILKLKTAQSDIVKKADIKTPSAFSFSLVHGFLTVPLVIIFTAKGFSVLGNASDSVGIAIHSSHLLPEDPGRIMGYFLASVSLGNILAYKTNAYLKIRSTYGIYFMCAAGLMSLFTILSFYQNSTPLIIAFALLAGVSEGLSEIYYVTHLQSMPDEVMVKVFSFSAIIEKGTGAMGMILASFLLEITTTKLTIFYAHGFAFLVISFSILYFLKLRKVNRS